MTVPLALALAAAPTGTAVPLVATAEPLRGPAVVMLWATWCASCQAELARLPRLVPAAAPLPIRTLAIDAPVDARTKLSTNGRTLTGAYADGRDKATVLADWGGPGAVLPLAVAIDVSGHICGRKAGLLGTDQLKAWARTCSK